MALTARRFRFGSRSVLLHDWQRRGNLQYIRDYVAFAAAAINEVGDPGVLANLLTAQPGGLRQEHELEIRCGSGRGRVEVTIENWVTTQSILRRS